VRVFSFFSTWAGGYAVRVFSFMQCVSFPSLFYFANVRTFPRRRLWRSSPLKRAARNASIKFYYFSFNFRSNR
jgi:hypothetical protein